MGRSPQQGPERLCKVLGSPTHLMRVGAVGHSGLANWGGWGREKQRGISEVTHPQSPTWRV